MTGVKAGGTRAKPALVRGRSDAPTKVGRRTVAAAIRRLLRARGAGKSICPSEVARVLDPSAFRTLMPEVREVAAQMARANEIIVTQRGSVIEDVERARGPIRLALSATSPGAYADAYRGVDFRKEPQKYRVGRGEEGVLIAEPYKSELLPLWRFRTEAIATASCASLWRAFLRYRRSRDFVGMDMARKYLQMGFTRARRYANHRSGKKYETREVREMPPGKRRVMPREEDAEKAAAARLFYEAWQRAERDPTYISWRSRVRKGAPA